MLEQVKASAGSGKTYALTERFLELLLSSEEGAPALACAGNGGGGGGYAWPEILAVTFTNKAAAEMKERIIGRLKALALSGKDERRFRARRCLESILRHYHRLNIRTIDSLLNLVLRLFALDLGVSPDFEVLFDEKSVLSILYDRLVGRAEAGDEEARELLEQAASALLRASGPRGFWLRETVKGRIADAFSYRLKSDGPVACDPTAIEAALADSHREFIETVSALDEILREGRLEPDKRFEGFLAKCAACSVSDEPPATSAYAAKESLGECLRKAGKSRLTEEAEEAYRTFKACLASHSAAAAAHSGVTAAAPFAALADMLFGSLETLQRERGVVLSARMPALAAGLLVGDEGRAVSDAYCRFGARLLHMLIDEFQDTSREQWQALEALAEECLSKGGRLFIVGDVKQAIYGWRGGDARLFDEVLSGSLAALVDEPTLSTLPCNWRSGRDIVGFNNAVFDALKDDETAANVAQAMLGDAPAEESAALAASIRAAFGDCGQEPRRGGPPGYVRIERLPGADKDQYMEAAEAAMAALMDDILSRRALSEVAVLVRSNNEAATVAGWLMKQSIPVMTESSLLLSAHPLIRQIVAFLAFIDYPLADIAFWEFAQGTELFLDACGLSREEVGDWLARQTKKPLYLAFRQDFPEIWQEHVDPFFRQAGLMSPYDMVREIVARFDVARRRPGDAVFLARFLEVVHLAESKGYGSLATFLEFWNSLGRDEKVPSPESVDAVRVMTMHKAKGLQFPAVIVPFHHWSEGHEAGELTECEILGERLILPLRKNLGSVYHERRRRLLQEQLHLLYVAWTRAEWELALFLPQDPALRGAYPIVRAADALLAKAGVPDGPLAELGLREAADAGKSAAETPPAADIPAFLAGSPVLGEKIGEAYHPMPWLPRLKIARHFDEDFQRDVIQGSHRRERDRGTLAHRGLELLAMTGDPAADVASAVRRTLWESDLPKAEQARLEPELLAMLDWVRGLPDFPLWQRGEPELEIMDGEGNRHRADRVVREGNRVLVVEYKTGMPSPEHEAQVRRYLSLLAPMAHGAGLGGVLVYLDQRQVVPVARD